MKILCLPPTPAKKWLNGYEKGELPIHPFYVMPLMCNYSIDTEFDDSPFASIFAPVMQPFEHLVGFRLLQPLKAIYKMHNYDLILSTDNRCMHFLLLTKLSTKYHKPFINVNVSLLNWALTAKRFKLFFTRQILRAASVHVVYSSHQIKKFNEIFKIPVEKINFIPFCVDDEYFKPQKFDSYDYISSVGKDIGRDYPTLLKSIGDVSCKVRIVCGSTNLNRTILPQNVDKLVNVPYLKVREVYSESKFVVLPLHCNKGSDATGQTALLEAMAMGKAVIASHLPSLLDYVDNWKTGIFVKPYDPKDMKSAIQYLLDNPGEADRIGRNARKAVENKFNHKIYARNLASLMWNVYENALD